MREDVSSRENAGKLVCTLNSHLLKLLTYCSAKIVRKASDD